MTTPVVSDKRIPAVV